MRVPHDGALMMAWQEIPIPFLHSRFFWTILTTGSLAQQPASSGEEKRLLALQSKGRTVPCRTWQGSTGRELYSYALHPSMIGDPTSNKRCKIIDTMYATVRMEGCPS